MKELRRTPLLLEFRLSGPGVQQSVASRSMRSGARGGRRWTGSPGDIGVGKFGLDPYYALGSRMGMSLGFDSDSKSKIGAAARKAMNLARMHLMITAPRPYSYAT